MSTKSPYCSSAYFMFVISSVDAGTIAFSMFVFLLCEQCDEMFHELLNFYRTTVSLNQKVLC